MYIIGFGIHCRVTDTIFDRLLEDVNLNTASVGANQPLFTCPRCGRPVILTAFNPARVIVSYTDHPIIQLILAEGIPPGDELARAKAELAIVKKVTEKLGALCEDPA